jgi:hypothetical protein
VTIQPHVQPVTLPMITSATHAMAVMNIRLKKSAESMRKKTSNNLTNAWSAIAVGTQTRQKAVKEVKANAVIDGIRNLNAVIW